VYIPGEIFKNLNLIKLIIDQISVGDADSKFLVTLLTLLVILGGTLFILHSLKRAAREIALLNSPKPKSD